jgi:hypothetical protein
MIAAVEIYNKPRFDYREECFTILLLNAWELILKAFLSKKGKSIFYKKKRREPYKTLSWKDAFNKAENFLPSNIEPLPVRKNLELLSTYRDNVIHFYNKQGFEVVIYELAQTAITNYKDLLKEAFNLDLGADIGWYLLPLGIKAPVNPIEYISGKNFSENHPMPAATRQFLSELRSAVEEVQNAHADTGRLLTIFTVKLESSKKIDKADVVVGVQSAGEEPGPLVIEKKVDPNITHPLRRKDILEKIGTLHGTKFTSYTFDAIGWKYDLKSDPVYCWKATEGVLTRYSYDIIPRINQLSESEVDVAINEYRKYMNNKERKRGEL